MFICALLHKDFDVPQDYQPPTLTEPCDLSAHSASAAFIDVAA